MNLYGGEGAFILGSMGLDSRDYMREVPIYRRLVGKDADSRGSGGGAGEPPSKWADPPHHEGRARTRPWAWFLLGVFVTITMVGVVTDNVPSAALNDLVDRPARGAAIPPTLPARLPRGTVAVVDGIPVVGRPLRIPLGGRETVAVGTSITIEGTTPTQRGGNVVVKMRREGGVWRNLRGTRAAQDGSYRVTYRIWNRGRTQVRIVYPGGSFAYKWYRVT